MSLILKIRNAMFILKLLIAFGDVLTVASAFFIVYYSIFWIIFSTIKSDLSDFILIFVFIVLCVIFVIFGILRGLIFTAISFEHTATPKTRAILAFSLGILVMFLTIYYYSRFDTFIMHISAALGLISSGILFRNNTFNQLINTLGKKREKST